MIFYLLFQADDSFSVGVFDTFAVTASRLRSVLERALSWVARERYYPTSRRSKVENRFQSS